MEAWLYLPSLPSGFVTSFLSCGQVTGSTVSGDRVLMAESGAQRSLRLGEPSPAWTLSLMVVAITHYYWVEIARVAIFWFDL